MYILLYFGFFFFFLFLIFCVGSKVGNNICPFFTMFMKKNLIKVFYIECRNSILNLPNLFYKKCIFFISIKNIKNIKFKNIFGTREDNLSSCKIPKYQKNSQIRMFWQDGMKKGNKSRFKELIKSKDLIKLLTGLIDLFKDLIEEKLSLKVNWANIRRIN